MKQQHKLDISESGMISVLEKAAALVPESDMVSFHIQVEIRRPHSIKPYEENQREELISPRFCCLLQSEDPQKVFAWDRNAGDSEIALKNFIAALPPVLTQEQKEIRAKAEALKAEAAALLATLPK